MNEQQKYEVIKELVEHGGNKNRAALTLGCTRRTIDRHIAGYRAHGKAYFIHGNRGRQPAHTIPETIKADILDFYTHKYPDANFAHFNELLEDNEKILVSESTIRNILAAAQTLSPKANRKTRRKIEAQLKAAFVTAKTKKEKKRIQAKLVDAIDAHPRRPRSANFGEMIQMDASLHLWFGEQKVTLHLAIDDATGIIVGARFERQETLQGYYQVLLQILTLHGIPFLFYTDRRTVFEYKKSGSQDTAEDTFTQFSYACKHLGIQIETTSIPQAKGRIERLNQTMQSRLPVELRLEGVTTIEQANEYLPGFIAKYNARFALPLHSIPSVFAPQPSAEKIGLTLAVIAPRTVDSGHSIRFQNKYFRTLNKSGRPVYPYQGTKGLVIHTFTDELFFSVEDTVYALEEIPLHERTSKNFDFKPPEAKPKKRSIPSATLPWRLSAFNAFLAKQPQFSA